MADSLLFDAHPGISYVHPLNSPSSFYLVKVAPSVSPLDSSQKTVFVLISE